ncbi:CSAD decarboxylase, partial [Nothocercus nigrocapillus]|nr:CSAD decarboxylase [Nothocercus nigrocapillus]
LEHPSLDKAAGEEFLQEAFQILLQEGIRKGMDAAEKVCEWKEPQELRELLDLELQSHGEPQHKVLERCRDVVRYSVKTCHPRFFNQLFSGLDHHALAGRMITETLNTSQYTYEIAPVFVLMEEVVLAKLRELLGWSGGDGIFAPGGSVSNMYAMNVARFRRFPESKRKGSWALPRLALFTSRESHYSIQKGAAFLGIGTDNVYLVGTDERGKMLPEELEKEIERAKAEGSVPFFVSATCGTTVLGAFDPLPSVAAVCQRHGLWLHVDVSDGGVGLSTTPPAFPEGGILQGRADSVAWNPHKMLTVGLQCSAFLLRDSSVGPASRYNRGPGQPRDVGDNAGTPRRLSQGLLQRCHGASATYLFQPDKFYDVSYDTGDKSIQCGRRVDCLKLWLLWKAVGTEGLERRVDRAFACTRYLAEELKRREGFQLVLEPEFINLCFWFVPPSLRGQEGSAGYWSQLGKVSAGRGPPARPRRVRRLRARPVSAQVAPAIKERMMRRGSMMVGYQPHGAKANFFRQIVTNPAVTRADLDFFLDEIERLGQDL